MKVSQRAAKLAECFATHPAWALGIALVFSLLAGWATLQLPVLTSRQALLPQNTPVTERFNHFLQNFGAASDLLVVLEGAPTTELEAFADGLAEKLRTEPENNQAISHIDLDFFLNHAYLLTPDAALEKLASLENTQIPTGGLEEILSKGLTWSKDPPMQGADANLQTAETSLTLTRFFLDEWLRWLSAETLPSGLDWNGLLAKTSMASMHDGYFTSRDGRLLFRSSSKKCFRSFRTAWPVYRQSQTDSGRPVQANSSCRPYATHCRPHRFTGDGVRRIHAYPPGYWFSDIFRPWLDHSLNPAGSPQPTLGTADLHSNGARGAVEPGAALVTVGHLTIITATFIAILFGLGADYGIFTSSRIAEERRAGKPLIAAIGAGVGASFGAVLTAGIASLLIFGALATVDFPGFAELGIVAAKGVLMILISTWVVQPALYAILPPETKRPAHHYRRKKSATPAKKSAQRIFQVCRVSASHRVNSVRALRRTERPKPPL